VQTAQITKGGVETVKGLVGWREKKKHLKWREHSTGCRIKKRRKRPRVKTGWRSPRWGGRVHILRQRFLRRKKLQNRGVTWKSGTANPVGPTVSRQIWHSGDIPSTPTASFSRTWKTSQGWEKTCLIGQRVVKVTYAKSGCFSGAARRRFNPRGTSRKA